MNLPIENRRYAIRKIISLNFLLVVVMITFGLNNVSKSIIVVYLVILTISSIFSFYYHKKHNIKSLKYLNNGFIAEYNSKYHEITFPQISNISTALNDYVKLNGRLTKMYIINLKEDFEFGNRILLQYEVKGSLKDDPELIKELKSKIKDS